MNRDMPLFEIVAMVKKEEDLESVREEIDKTISEFQSKPVSLERLTALQRRQKYRFLMNLDTPNKVAGGMARFVSLTGGIGVVEELYAAFDRVSAQDILHAARKYFLPERRTVVILKGARQ